MVLPNFEQLLVSNADGMSVSNSAFVVFFVLFSDDGNTHEMYRNISPFGDTSQQLAF